MTMTNNYSPSTTTPNRGDSSNANNNNNNNNNYQKMEDGNWIEMSADEAHDRIVASSHITTKPSEESHTRSILKGITWRLVATMTTVVIAWLVIGDATVAFQIGFFEVFAKIAIYYVHERIWARIPV